MKEFRQYMVPGTHGYLIGIGGVSMSPLAEVLAEGYQNMLLSDQSEERKAAAKTAGKEKAKAAVESAGKEKAKAAAESEAKVSVKTVAEAAVKIEEKTEKMWLEIELQESDSGSGLAMLLQGSVDVALLSRELTEEEQEKVLWAAVAMDGLVILVNEQNPVESLTKEEIRRIFMGEERTWSK